VYLDCYRRLPAAGTFGRFDRRRLLPNAAGYAVMAKLAEQAIAEALK
jgi:hypothetical protein